MSHYGQGEWVPPAPTPEPTPEPPRKGRKAAVIVIAAFVVILIVAAVAITLSVTKEPVNHSQAAGTSAPASTTEASRDVKEEAFYRTVSERGLYLASPRADVIQLGYTACTYLRSTKDPRGAVDILVDGTTSYADAEYFVGAAVSAFCPDLDYLF